ncbi:aldehyde dehydrogenase (NADP(+)) [Pseudomonas aegrilactucae]|uniref:Aldehyde dehydrogenase (NADP(+)) n=1 Tax=Pseudomonas aegrilactucae TaxID=2854028 RepID=A0A9Q2XQS6_9PSED|nr:aldehyde dehydrogenase (NADP(+)) [Pseudomonas aegrilactucae]MBV6290171.1 aldehyde dehydrogenase (NADP(+)) [Pseudomonas aegrilactucae]
MQLTGEQLIGHEAVRGEGRELLAINPGTRQAIDTPVFNCATAVLVDRACALAEQAFDPLRATAPDTRARFLEAIADGLLELGSVLTERAHSETGLPMARLEGERGRTVGQLRLFASVLRQGRWHNATFDSALPDRQPLPRPDLRMCRVALGPVAIFGASNFPLAFSVAGGDTASALAAGCPVVFKAHRAHLGTAELVARVVQAASRRLALPAGTFSLVIGDGNDVGQQLVSHPAIKAVGFTGSRAGGLALIRAAAARAEPIPVYAEMSSINPVFLLPGALSARAGSIATAFVDALVMGAGQFCTNPGVVLGVEGPGLQAFLAQATAHLAQKAAQTMLTPGIHCAYEQGIERIAKHAEVEAIASGLSPAGATQAQAHLFQLTSAQVAANPGLLEEVFGPAAIVIRCQDTTEMLAFARSVEGQLTATLHLEEEDLPVARGVVQAMEKKAGRVLVNGFPTGVEVCDSMVHGGAYPATSDSRTTSVGSSAIERFLRPVCYQSVPDALLPEALKQGNPLGIWRQVDGQSRAPRG